jgi:HAD superfamily hydrolase (TIGR01484 family)
MKKILVSDYDRTIYLDDDTTKKNVEAIKKFMKDDIAVIATGRSFADFSGAIKKYNIDSSYYLLNYGNLVLDRNFNVIFEQCLEKKELDEITSFFREKECDIYYCNKDTNSKEIVGNIYKVVLVYKDKKKQMHDYDEFVKKYNYLVFILKSHSHLEVISTRMDKSLAIEEIERREKSNLVYVIGDSDNDITMIKKYNGYCVKNASIEVKKISSKIYDSVSSLIDELMEED